MRSGSVAAVLPSDGRNWWASSIIIQTMGMVVLVSPVITSSSSAFLASDLAWYIFLESRPTIIGLTDQPSDICM